MEALLAFSGGGGLLDDLGVNPRVLGVQVVIFVTTFILLSRILFGRVLDHVTRREEEVKKAQEAIAHDRAEVARMTREYEAHLAKADKEAYDRFQALLKDAIAQAQALVGKAQADARQEVERAQVEIAREKREAMTRLKGDVARLTVEVAEKVLETKLDGSMQATVQKMLESKA